LEAGDLFSLNSVLGGTIEIQVTETLNKRREIWDPNESWVEAYFTRSSQTFPDVRLVTNAGGVTTPIMGIELKGWYMFSKEAVPSFRYTATPAACSPYDLLVVVPWHLSNVLSGTPRVYKPYIEQARYVAERRNYFWQYERVAKASKVIAPPAVAVTAYPLPKTQMSDKPESDSGNNFGRIARTPGLMADFTNETLDIRVSGIPTRDWLKFFKRYSEDRDPALVSAELEALLTNSPEAKADAERVMALVRELAAIAGQP